MVTVEYMKLKIHFQCPNDFLMEERIEGGGNSLDLISMSVTAKSAFKIF
jgi:hypothetical protein